ncbi:hypothetical protein BDY19DRAFT_219707 [Irpex rosettiformis]|uniref:Uncharacterized protein n=1 Tax=Irpex rosettiformis TaxID=378272 RepID=A0ACB8U0P3_9APHY|nr:hypothetical protein BDY19DRAFT_219707 [Irpex rosettiformis]
MHTERLAKKRKTWHYEALRRRAPAFINLPIPNDVPILGPLLDDLNPVIGAEPSDGPLSPLIDFNALKATTKTTKMTATQPPPTTTAAPTPTPTLTQATPQPPATQPAPSPTTSPTTPGSGSSDNSHGGGSSNNSGGTNQSGGDKNSSGNGKSNSSNQSGQQSSSGKGGNSTASGSGSGSGSNSNSSDSGSGPAQIPSGSSAEQSRTSSDVTFSTSNGSVIPVHTQAAIANAGSAPLSGDSGSNEASGGDGSTGSTESATGGSDSDGTASSGTGAGGSGSTGSGSESGSGSGHESSSGTGGTTVDGSGTNSSGGSGDGSGGGGNSIDGGTGSSGHHGLPTGVIAAIAVVAGLLLLVLLVCFCRRRAIHKRVASRKQWFRSQQPTSMYAGISSSGYFKNKKTVSKPPSVRSSFGTNDDYDPFEPLPPPPLPLGPEWPLPRNSESEMTQASGVIVALPSPAATAFTAASPTIRSGSDRNSVESLISLGAGDENLFRPAPTPSQVLTIIPPPPLSDDSHNLPTPMSVRPFSPTERWSFPTPPTTRNSLRNSAQLFNPTSLPALQAASVQYPPRMTSTSPISDEIVDFYTAPEDSSPENPFSDFTSSNDHATIETFLTATTTYSTTSQFTIERVSRPFAPALSDEIAVNPGDEVRVLKQFDDGWAYAEVVSSGRRGLFPIDCLRSPDLDLPAFLAAKRLSSYAGFVMPPSPVKLVH